MLLVIGVENIHDIGKNEKMRFIVNPETVKLDLGAQTISGELFPVAAAEEKQPWLKPKAPKSPSAPKPSPKPEVTEELVDEPEPSPEPEPAPSKKKREYKCSGCGKPGVQRRTCSVCNPEKSDKS